MTYIRPRSRLTLHSGGSTVRNKRLTGVRASERATAPGQDIRDIGPDTGPRKCRNCSKPVGRPRAVHCDSCLADRELVQNVRAELKRLGVPPLGQPAPTGSPLSKKRRKAEAALRRLGKGTTPARAGRPKKATKKAPAKVHQLTAVPTCPTCFVALPSTGRCDDCP